jgi:RecB family exonuclease
LAGEGEGEEYPELAAAAEAQWARAQALVAQLEEREQGPEKAKRELEEKG